MSARCLFAAALAGCIGLAVPAGAQEPTLARMSHASWTARDGAPQGIREMAQAPDGTLWVGTDGGLYSFDGRTFTAFQPPAGEPQLPPVSVRSLLVTRDGTLWVGFLGAPAARIARGRVTLYESVGEQGLSAVDQLREARDGTVWAIANQSTLMRFGRGDTAWGADATPREVADMRIGGLYVDASDVLWLAQGERMFRRQLPGTTYTVAGVPADVVMDFAETPGGDIWMADYDMRANHGRVQRFDRRGRRLASLSHPSNAGGIVHAPDGSLVVALSGRLHRFRADSLAGLTTLPLGPAADSYDRAEELGAGPGALLLDADRNIWVGGRRALHRLRAPRLVPFHAHAQGGSWTLCAGARGAVFLAANGIGLFRVGGGSTSRISTAEQVVSVSCGSDGVTRAFGPRELWEVREGRLEPIPSIPGAPPYALGQVVAMPDHTLYGMVGGNTAAFGGVWRFRNGRWTKLAAEGDLARAGQSYVDSRGRLWVGYRRGLIGLPLEGRLLSSGTPGLDDVVTFLETPHGFLAAGTYGVAVLRDTSFQMLAFADRASTRGVAGLVQSRNGDLWLNAVQGIVRVPAAELAAGLADPRYPMRSERVTEGHFTGPAMTTGSTTTAARAADGTLWFAMLNGVVSYAPDAPPPRSRPPVLSIRSITADRVPPGARRTFDPQPRTLAIRYFGVDLTAPDRVRYRYRLDGFDPEWQEAGGRTEAIYTRPPPGTYTFRVMAANEAGAWTEPVASVPFTVLPSFWQTRWFAVLAAAALAALAWLAYTLRVRSITAVLRERFDATLAERTRVARELHDTLLGDMAGLAMQLSAGARRVEASGAADREVVQLLAGLGAQAQRALSEARRSVTGMRAVPEPLPLHERLADAARRAFAGTAVAVHVEHSGSPRPLAPGVEAEILGIAAEALSNARRHAECRSVTVACDYAPRELRVRVRDDGRGFDPTRAAPAGHWGLAGMRERAASVGATLAVASAPGAGTEVALVLPAGKRPRRWWPRLAGALAASIGLIGPAGAQAPSLAEMDRAAWTARDGAPQGVRTLAQARDGTLWVGTFGGLFNFDGHSFSPFESPAGEPQLPSETVRSLLVTRDGALWVGFLQAGAARIARGHVAIDTVAGTGAGMRSLNAVDQLRESRDGSVWAIADQSALVRFAPGDTAWRVEPMPPEVANTRASGVYVDRSDVLWLAQGGHLFRRQLPDTTYTRAEAPADIVFGFAETPGGDVWMTDFDMAANHGRTQRFDRHGRPLLSFRHENNAAGILHGADGSLLVALNGLLRRYRADTLTGRRMLPPDSASDAYGSAPGDRASMAALLLDADGNIWVGGRRGIERLRAPRLVPLRAGGMTGWWSVCGNARGEVFVAGDGLFSVGGGTVRPLPAPRDLDGLTCGNDGTTRVTDPSAIWEVRAGGLERVPSIPGMPPYTLLQLMAARDRTLYAVLGGNAAAFGGVWRYRGGRWTKLDAPGVLRSAGYGYVDSRGRLWMGYNRGRIGLPLEGRLLRSGASPGIGNILAFLESPRGFFAAGTYGLAVLRDTSFQMLTFADRASTRGVAGLVESRDGDLYLNAVRGIVRVRAAELRAGLADPRYPMKSEPVTEGEFTGPAFVYNTTTTAARASDGTLWFSMLNGVVRYDPDAPHSGGRPPILSIRSITADRVPLGAGRTFDPQPGTLAIRYLGVNLTAPDRVRYRYKLEGFDREWQDAGGRTEAIYTRPPPGTYTFRVMAANEAGAWTAPVSSVAFTVLPSFWQTRWFAALAAAALAALAWLAYTLRVRSITRLVRARAEERADERVRVARELHDTLLGDMAGLAMQLSAGARRVEASGAADREVVQLLGGLGAQVQRALSEARRSVTGMRAAPGHLPPLHERLAEAARRAFAGTAVAVHVEHSGAPRPYPPAVEAEVLAVAAEALSNARRHAECRSVTVACDYAARELRVRVRDDGRGFDPARPAPAGHWGLAGMRERAASVGATLAVASAPGAGTEVALVLPAGERRRKGWTRLLRPGRG